MSRTPRFIYLLNRKNEWNLTSVFGRSLGSPAVEIRRGLPVSRPCFSKIEATGSSSELCWGGALCSAGRRPVPATRRAQRGSLDDRLRRRADFDARTSLLVGPDGKPSHPPRASPRRNIDSVSRSHLTETGSRNGQAPAYFYGGGAYNSSERKNI